MAGGIIFCIRRELFLQRDSFSRVWYTCRSELEVCLWHRKFPIVTPCCWQSDEELTNWQLVAHLEPPLWLVGSWIKHFVCAVWEPNNKPRGQQMKQIAWGRAGWNDPYLWNKHLWCSKIWREMPPAQISSPYQMWSLSHRLRIWASSSSELSEVDSHSLSGQLLGWVSVVLWTYTAHFALHWDWPPLCFTGPVPAVGLSSSQ